MYLKKVHKRDWYRIHYYEQWFIKGTLVFNRDENIGRRYPFTGKFSVQKEYGVKVHIMVIFTSGDSFCMCSSGEC